MDTQSLNSQQSADSRLVENYKSALTQGLEREDENEQQISESFDSGDNATLNSGTGEFSFMALNLEVCNRPCLCLRLPQSIDHCCVIIFIF